MMEKKYGCLKKRRSVVNSRATFECFKDMVEEIIYFGLLENKAFYRVQLNVRMAFLII